jgi:transposase
MRYEDPLKILEIMRLLEEQTLSHREIAGSVNCGKTTVGEIRRRCKEHSLTYAEAVGMSNADIKARLYPKLTQTTRTPDPDWEAIDERMKKHPRLNLQFIWTEEYRPVNPDGLSYSQFCRRYHKWAEKTGREIRMVREHVPGKEMYVDWAGDTLDLVIGGRNGKVTTVHFFITVLGTSGHPYVEAFLNEQEACWLMGHVHAFEWYGGVPRIVVPDNTKTAVTKPNYYDPVLNRAYCDLAKHYMVGVIPARIKKPRDKSPVEGTVGWIETWLLEWLRGCKFFSLDDLNIEIRKRIRELASVPYKKRPGSRQSVFDELDKPALRPLPSCRYEHAAYAVRKVPDNYHIEHDGFYYSVPYTLFKRYVTIRATLSMIEVINENGERVCLHKKHFSGSRYVTLDEHMPEKHRKQRGFDRRNGDNYRSWAKTVGENTYQAIDTLLRAQIVEETAYKSCMGILQMVSSFGQTELEVACGKAITMGSVTYTTIKRLITSVPLTSYISEPTPSHENLRDPSEFN